MVFEGFGKKIDGGIDTLDTKAKELAATNKLKDQIKEQEKLIDQAYYDLGKKIYEENGGQEVATIRIFLTPSTHQKRKSVD